MQILSRLFLLMSVVGSAWLLFYEPASRATPQLGYGCNAFATNLDQCATGCSQVEVQQYSNGEGATRLDTVFVECDAEPCVGMVTRAVPNPACCDRDNDSFRGTRPGCGTGSDCNDNNPSVHPEATELWSDGIDNDCQGGDEACPPCPSPDCNEGGSAIPVDYCTYPGTGCPDLYVNVGSCCQPYNPSPIVIDVDRLGFRLTNADDGVWFNFFGTDDPIHLSWTQPGSTNAWLVLDRNSNGQIDNGAELFGNLTPQPRSQNANGFIALGEYDKLANGGNGDLKIGPADSIYSSLRLWQDSNHNGVSEAAELHTLAELGIESISLDYKLSRKTDEHGNQFRYRAKVDDAKHSKVSRWAWDVFLVRRP